MYLCGYDNSPFLHNTRTWTFFTIVFERIYLTSSQWRHIETSIPAVYTKILLFAYYCSARPTYVHCCRTNGDFWRMGMLYFVVFVSCLSFCFFYKYNLYGHYFRQSKLPTNRRLIKMRQILFVCTAKTIITVQYKIIK